MEPTIFVAGTICTFFLCFVLLATTVSSREKLHVSIMFFTNAILVGGMWGFVSTIVSCEFQFVICEFVAYTAVVFVCITGAYLYPWVVLSIITALFYCLFDCHITELFLACAFALYSYYWTIEHTGVIFKVLGILEKYEKSLGDCKKVYGIALSQHTSKREQ